MSGTIFFICSTSAISATCCSQNFQLDQLHQKMTKRMQEQEGNDQDRGRVKADDDEPGLPCLDKFFDCAEWIRNPTCGCAGVRACTAQDMVQVRCTAAVSCHVLFVYGALRRVTLAESIHSQLQRNLTSVREKLATHQLRLVLWDRPSPQSLGKKGDQKLYLQLD